MDISKDTNIKIIGVGKVGISIVQAFAQCGFTVCGIDVDQANLDQGLAGVEKNLDMLVGKGKIDAAGRDEILERMTLSTDLEVAADAEVVIEAVFEDLAVKKELFAKLDEIVALPEALLLTNTSSMSVSEIASVTKRPGQVAGMHFFNPVTVMKLVEVINGVLTTPDTVAKIKQLTGLMGKTAIVSADSPGFIVNRMLNALVVEATKIVEEGVGTVEDVDAGARLGLGHRMGPLELFDYLNAIGLLNHVTNYMSVELGDRFRLPVWVKNLVRAGKTGRAAGKGFYDYSDSEK